jgi:putative acetyltransferase
MIIDAGIVTIRPFVPRDAAELADVLRDSIRGLGAVAYTPGQIEAWARYPEDLEEFRVKLSGGITVVAEQDGCVVAFGQLNPADHVEFLYCRTSHARRGIASRIHHDLEAVARATGAVFLRTEASRVSRPFFEALGYRLEQVEQVERCGEILERFRMSKELGRE